jgi:hypothetical protein
MKDFFSQDGRSSGPRSNSLKSICSVFYYQVSIYTAVTWEQSAVENTWA